MFATPATLMLLTIAAAQDGTVPKQPESVAELVTVVRDVAKFAAQLGASKGDSTAVLFALAERNGALIGAVEKVVGAHQEKQGVAELVQILQASRQSSKVTDELVCANASFALGELGSVAADALPTLALFKDHPSPLARGDALEAQEKIKKASAKP